MHDHIDLVKKALQLVESAPDAMLFPDFQGIFTALVNHTAFLADGFGPAFPLELLFFALKGRRREEHSRVRPTAGCLYLPGPFTGDGAHS